MYIVTTTDTIRPHGRPPSEKTQAANPPLRARLMIKEGAQCADSAPQRLGQGEAEEEEAERDGGVDEPMVYARPVPASNEATAARPVITPTSMKYALSDPTVSCMKAIGFLSG